MEITRVVLLTPGGTFPFAIRTYEADHPTDPEARVALLPGGKTDPNEAPYDCAVRETWEEFGVRIKAMTEFLVVPDARRGATMRFYVARKSAGDWEGVPRICEPGKFEPIVHWTWPDQFASLCALLNAEVGVGIEAALQRLRL